MMSVSLSCLFLTGCFPPACRVAVPVQLWVPIKRCISTFQDRFSLVFDLNLWKRIPKHHVSTFLGRASLMFDRTCSLTLTFDPMLLEDTQSDCTQDSCYQKCSRLCTKLNQTSVVYSCLRMNYPFFFFLQFADFISSFLHFLVFPLRKV